MDYKTYSDISREYSERIVPYSILLTAREWFNKRNIIIVRENNTCQICKTRCMDEMIPKMLGNFVKLVPGVVEENEELINFYDSYGNIEFSVEVPVLKLVEQLSPKIPHVHHRYYLKNNLPWEYPNEDLMLVCHECHTNIHNTTHIPVYLNNKKFDLCHFTPCSRCHGAGYLPEFNYWQNGLCFKCKGACFEEWD